MPHHAQSYKSQNYVLTEFAKDIKLKQIATKFGPNKITQNKICFCEYYE